MTTRWKRIVVIVAAFALALTACGDDAESTTTAAPAGTEAPATETTAAATTAAPSDTTAAASGPTELGMALIIGSVIEEPWYSSMWDAMNRAAEASPHGLAVTTEFFEGIGFADAERVIRELATSGKYGIIFAHSTYSDAIDVVKDDFPDMLFVFSGAGNTATGGNGYWIDMVLHEPAYLAGIAAGMMTETNGLGAVGAFPFPNVTGPINAFFDGARSVNPEIAANATFLESWFDPTAGKEAAEALISTGADTLYPASAFGVFEAVDAGERVFGVGDFIDQEALAPEVVIVSAVAKWDPAVNTMVDAWWEHNANGTAYDGNMEELRFFMAEGGSDISPFNDALVPADVQEAVNEARDKIMSGELVVELNGGDVVES